MSKDSIYGTKHAAAIYGVTEQTIRLWSDEFAHHLSFHANPGNRRTRQFTQDDMGILSLIAELKKRGSTYADIHSALQNGERGSVPDELEIMLSADEERRFSLEIEYLRREVDELRRHRDEAQKLAAEAETLRLENARLLAKVEALEREVEKAQELGKAQGELAILRRMLDGKSGSNSSSDSPIE